ncbi:MAG TPA: hypothetical protein VNX40_07290 [Mucilaginibacter sp.]|jgi:hypothetical protein|nr:hypothetical protein [Mucilaginibacter sp.]
MKQADNERVSQRSMVFRVKKWYAQMTVFSQLQTTMPGDYVPTPLPQGMSPVAIDPSP